MKHLGTIITDEWRAHKAQARLTARVTIAGLAAFMLVHALHIPQGYWTVLTAVLVVQSTVGGSLKAAIDRVIGTLAGAFYGVVIALVMPHDTVWQMMAALTVGIVPTAYMAAFNPGYRIAPVTVVITLLGTGAPQAGLVHYAIERVAEIALGSLLGLAISLTVLPSRAHAQVGSAAADVLDLFGVLVNRLIGSGRDGNAYETARTRLNEIRAALVRLDTATDEAKRERASYLSGAADPEPLVRIIRRIRHDLVMTNRILMTAMPDAAMRYLAEPLKDIAAAIEAFLNMASTALRGHPAEIALADKAFAGLPPAIAALRTDEATAALPTGDIERIFALTFTLEQLHGNLKDLAGVTATHHPGIKKQTETVK